MAWRLHHVNIAAPNFSETLAFYKEVLGMQSVGMPIKKEDRGVFKYDDDNVAWFEDGNAQIHMSRPNPNMARDNNYFVNPSLGGHVAIEVDDIEEVKRRLNARRVYFADPGHWAVEGLYQIYVIDPSMNCVEINQQLDT